MDMISVVRGRHQTGWLWLACDLCDWESEIATRGQDVRLSMIVDQAAAHVAQNHAETAENRAETARNRATRIEFGR